jgi:hypothetical protein
MFSTAIFIALLDSKINPIAPLIRRPAPLDLSIDSRPWPEIEEMQLKWMAFGSNSSRKSFRLSYSGS